jgi:hypothetical protein
MNEFKDIKSQKTAFFFLYRLTDRHVLNVYVYRSRVRLSTALYYLQSNFETRVIFLLAYATENSGKEKHSTKTKLLYSKGTFNTETANSVTRRVLFTRHEATSMVARR